MGKQHQGMDSPGVRQVPEGSGEQGKMEKPGRKIICGAPTILAVKGLIMMMMQNYRGAPTTLAVKELMMMMIMMMLMMMIELFMLRLLPGTLPV